MNPVADVSTVRAAAAALEELMPQLLQLSADARLEVIARLSQSLKSTPSVKKSLLDFAGAWSEMPGTDEEIMAGIRDARHFTRPDISLD